jgi:hypothetical protein
MSRFCSNATYRQRIYTKQLPKNYSKQHNLARQANVRENSYTQAM